MNDIYILVNTKMKLLSRNSFGKFKLNSLIIIISFYCFFLYQIHLNESVFFSLSALAIIITAIDYHSILNNSSLKGILLFNFLLNKKKCIKLNVITDVLIKGVFLFPVLFLLNEQFLILILVHILNIIVFHMIRELVYTNFFYKRIFSIVSAVPFFSYMLLSGFSFEKTKKQLTILNYIDSNILSVTGYILCIQFFLIILFGFLYLKNFHVITEMK